MCQQLEDEDNNNNNNNNNSSNDPLLEPLPIDRTTPCQGLTVQPNDVICDRDVAAQQHPGNVEYRKIIRRHRAAYQNADKRINKQMVRDEVIDLIYKTNGRFLVKDCGIWVEQDMDKVRDKVSHGLRSSANSCDECNMPTTQQTRKRKAPPPPSMELLEAEERLFESLVATQESIYATYLQQQQLQQQQMGETADNASAESSNSSSSKNHPETQFPTDE